jgi:alpha-galactosidase
MAIQFDSASRRFVLQMPNSTYAMGLGGNALLHLWWGASMPRIEDLPTTEGISPSTGMQEYHAWGEYFFDEPALKATFADGTRDTRLRYVSHEIDGNELRILLRDTFYPLSATLVYRIYDDCDIVDRHCILRNEGDDPIALESVQSASWYLPRGKAYRLTSQGGRWGREFQPQRWDIGQGKVLLETRRGVSGPDQTPFFWIDANGTADEQQGKVWFGAVQWSGNWKIAVEKNRDDRVRITGGINDFDTIVTLAAGESFTTPVFTGGYTEGGFGASSRMLHDYQRQHVMRPGRADMLMPLIYNSWGTFQFNIDEQRMMDLAEIAAGIGVELFVIDDGWFGNRINDRCSLGDWTPSPDRFPNGLNPLIDKVNSLGMDFGIWLEPEMVSPDSDLYRAHPDWVFHFPTREGSQYRHQLTLNLAREDVKEFAYETMRSLLAEHNIKYFKLDNNRYISEAGWPAAAPADQRAVWVKYVENFYEIFDRLAKEFPHVILENCASGGGRVDLSMQQWFDRMNRSDNQDPLDAVSLHEGFTMANLSKMAGGACHISQSMRHINGRLTPRRFQAHVGMLGSLAIGENLFECTPEQLEELAGYVKLYKEIRPTTQRGDLYRLLSIRDNRLSAFQYVSKDRQQAVLIALGQAMQFRDVLPNIVLQGLDPDTVYEVEGYAPMSGQGLMTVGIPVKLRGDFDSKVVRIDAQTR